MSSKIIKGLVSKKKKRYQKDGFDLDLSYICGNVIAMGFPGDRIEAIYRNDIDEVSRFLEAKHPDRYKIYNLCSERSYDPQKFKGRVAHFPFKDHNPPNLSIIPRFCSDVQNWLRSNSENVAVVHCKAGKGRTGVMICCYLLHSNQVSTANAAMSYYAQERTKDSKGVTIPSQRRYVEYYEKILKSPGCQYVQRPVVLQELTLEGTISTVGTICLVITQSGTEDCKYSTGHGGIELKKTGGAPFTIELTEPLILSGDIKVELFLKNVMTKQKLFHFWFNTFFIDNDSNSTPELASFSAINRTTTRLILQGTQAAVRSSSDNVRELERTLSCPPPGELQHPSAQGVWVQQSTRSDELKKDSIPSMHLSFQKSHLDKPHKNLITSKSNFRISLSFSKLGEDQTSAVGPSSPLRCFRSNSDTNTAHPSPLRYSSSSSSSSCTDDDLSSEGSGDSTGALVGGRGDGKHYKF